MNAELTFWGHNCFLVETDTEALLMDPWLNDTGAFFGSWHQWPPNGQLRGEVLARCAGKALAIRAAGVVERYLDPRAVFHAESLDQLGGGVTQ